MIYMDNAATSWPKPEETKREIEKVMEKFAANPGRGAYPLAKGAAKYLKTARKEIADFLGIDHSEHLIFTSGNTESANIVLKSFLKPGDHLIYTSSEHNAVRRPIYDLSKKGVAATMVDVCAEEEQFLERIKKAFCGNTKLLVINAGSNVTGHLNPLTRAAEIAKKRNIRVYADMAQTAGIINISPRETNVDFMGYAGHKGLNGFGGIGALYVRDPSLLNPLILGGTGKLSYLKNQAGYLPEGFEAGTQNLIGIGGMLGGIRYIKKQGRNRICEHEAELTSYFLEELKKMDHIKVYRFRKGSELPVVSLNVGGMFADRTAEILAKKADIAVRSGLHCAPDMHRQIGTAKTGSVRFSFGFHNTFDQIDDALKILYEL